jgi:hypothetical protein
VILWKIPPFAAAKAGVWKRDAADDLWEKLRGEAVAAYQAMADLHAGGDEAVAVLKGKIRVDPEGDRAAIFAAVAELGSATYAVREKAAARLEAFGYRFNCYAAEALARVDNLEQKRRLVGLHERILATGIDAESLRLGRAVYVLEHIGTPAARQALETIARGHVRDVTAESAKAALQRFATK